MRVTVTANLLQKLDELCEQYDGLCEQLVDPEVLADHRQVRSLSIRRAAIEPLVKRYCRYRDLQQQIRDNRAIIDSDEDQELKDLAREELEHLESSCDAIIQEVQRNLVTADDQSIASIIVEIRAGVGGDEAGLFAGDLIAMYERFAVDKGWGFEWMQSSPAEIGGYKQAIISISGEGVWAQLGYEGGTHQVKRVPATEAQGRVHTSTATVAVLPEPEDVDVTLDPNDVKESITTAQGPGGQNVNKVATAVHLIHEPTGIEVRMQETKSQSQNREKAWKLLKARLYERQKAAKDAERAETRNAMIGRGSRAEKIRTYRWKENIVVDHRLGGSEGTFNLTEVMAGKLQPLIDALIEQDTAQRLAGI